MKRPKRISKAIIQERMNKLVKPCQNCGNDFFPGNKRRIYCIDCLWTNGAPNRKLVQFDIEDPIVSTQHLRNNTVMTNKNINLGLSGFEEFAAMQILEKEERPKLDQFSVNYCKAEDGLPKRMIEKSDWE